MKRSLGRPRRQWADNVESDVRVSGSEETWTLQAADKIGWRWMVVADLGAPTQYGV